EQASVQDDFEYSYYENSNKLRNVDGSAGNNYTYDEIGNLISDASEGITGIEWSLYGKIRSVSKMDGTKIEFRYNASGNRIQKKTGESTQNYVRDASGNSMAIYEKDSLREQSIIGNTRHGVLFGTSQPGYRKLGIKQYELSNHLGNVLTVVSDKINQSSDSTWAEIIKLTDYYPFGLAMEGRTYQDSLTYRYGFNGKENDLETGTQDYGFRIYDPRVAKFLSIDPLARDFPWNSTYAFAENDVIRSIDLEGLEKLIMTNVDAKKKTAQITIKKDIQIINSPNLPSSYASIDNNKVNNLFSKGNTTIYTKEIPVNGKPVEFGSKKDWLKKGGYKINVKYEVNVNVVDYKDSDFSHDGKGGEISTVYTSKTNFVDAQGNSRPEVAARAGTTSTTDTQVVINPGFGGGLSPEEVLVHEVGIHNMAGKLHQQTPKGNVIYPRVPTLESNIPGKIYPVENDTKSIINKNLKLGRLENEN
ncbi:RHS repeat-associated core domain-containing protein, partial [Litoribacter ruber]|uniref:RHS repeat domain-containing protein n=1 Tax=Litoribacter ruber TaxID=702568 RepID=UPI001BDAA5CA